MAWILLTALLLPCSLFATDIASDNVVKELHRSCDTRLAELAATRDQNKSAQRNLARSIADTLETNADLNGQDNSWDPVRELVGRLK